MLRSERRQRRAGGDRRRTAPPAVCTTALLLPIRLDDLRSMVLVTVHTLLDVTKALNHASLKRMSSPSVLQVTAALCSSDGNERSKQICLCSPDLA
jgi:hypothetical protein